MAQADWITYGNEGGAKAQQIARLRELLANAGAFTGQDTQAAQLADQGFGGYLRPDERTEFTNPLLAQYGFGPAKGVYGQGQLVQSTGDFDSYYEDGPLTGYSVNSRVMADPEREGKKGYYNLTFGTDGTLSDAQWRNQELSGGFLRDNMDWLGPALVGGAAFLGAGGLGGLGSSAAPISASPISSLGPAASLSDIAAFTGAIPASSGALGGSMATPSILSQLGQGASNLLGGGSNTLGLLSSLVNAYSQNRQGAAQQDWAERLYQDRSQFLQPLMRSYTNPEEFLTGPEYSAVSGTVLDQLQRQDAAKGRLATDVQRQKLMQDHAMTALGNYRSGLATAAGLTGTQGLADLYTQGLANQYGTFNAPLAEIARGQSNGGYDFSKILDRVFSLGSWF